MNNLLPSSTKPDIIKKIMSEKPQTKYSRLQNQPYINLRTYDCSHQQIKVKRKLIKNTDGKAHGKLAEQAANYNYMHACKQDIKLKGTNTAMH